MPYCFIFPPGKPHKSRLISPLSRHIRPHFSHALGGLSAGDTLPAVRAVNSPVGAGRKGRTAHATPPHILRMVKLGVQLLICGQYRDTEPFTEQGIGNKLRAYALVPVVKQDTVSAIIIAARPAYKGVDFPALGRREPLDLVHTSSAG